MAQSPQIEQSQGPGCDWARQNQRVTYLVLSRDGAADLDQNRGTLGIGLNAEPVTFHKRMVGKVRNLMVFNGFIEYIEKCPAKNRAVGRSWGDAYEGARSEGGLDWENWIRWSRPSDWGLGRFADRF